MKKIKNNITIVIIFTMLISFIIASKYYGQNHSEAVSAVSVRRVNPIGRTIGLKLYTNGVLVVGMSEIDGQDGKKYTPYQNSGIKEGDMIKKIDGEKMENVEELTKKLNTSEGKEITITYQRDDAEINTIITPIKSNDNSYMIGLWVRDAGAGIGTLTYYEQATSRFAALGHGINDVDTEKILNISNGDLVTSQIISVIKGQKGKPGEIRGIIDNGEDIGKIKENTDFGVYGTVTNIDYINNVKKEEIPVANRNQIKTGKAKILCQLSNADPEEYEIEIEKIYKNNSKNNKSMLIKITDKNLLSITGGIIPGMSGTPIIQDGKFIGAITNVLLNDPTHGYAIFADLMM